MFLYAVLIIKEILNMLKGNPKPASRWSPVAREYPKRITDLEETDVIAEPQQVHRRPVQRLSHGRRYHAMLYKIPRDIRPVESLDEVSQIHSPNNEFHQTEFRSRSTPRATSPVQLTLYETFLNTWCYQEVIGEGGDGTVHLYQRDDRGTYVAVKVPRYSSSRKDLQQEITNMRLIGQHEHILQFCAVSDDWYPCGPAIILPYCELGSLAHYRQLWCEQQAWEGQPECVSEITIWKLFRDMALALSFLHSELGIRYVHNDFKPANILAVAPQNRIQYRGLPEEPTFKLSDFARLTPWPTPKGQLEQRYDGTPEYAPPMHEQRAPVHPSADIWALGATLQFMALGINPIQSKSDFIRCRKAQGKSHPTLEDGYAWASEYWRSRIPTVYRPIDVPLKVLQKDHDLPRDLPGYQPYSAHLGFWYAQLWNPVATRPKASQLAAQVIPRMDSIVARIKLERFRQMDEF